MLISICYRILTVTELTCSSSITTFEQLPNLFFEDLGITRMYHDEWKLIPYIDLYEYIEVETQLQQGLNNLRAQCETLNRFRYTVAIDSKELDKACYGIISNMQIQFKRIVKDRRRLYSTLGIEITINRSKRGVFDFVGDIIKILFGTMSSSDVEYYNKEIDNIHNDNKRIAELFANQTQILKLVIHSTKNVTDQINQKLDTLDRTIQLYNLNQNNTVNFIIANKKTIILDETVASFEISISELSAWSKV